MQWSPSTCLNGRPLMHFAEIVNLMKESNGGVPVKDKRYFLKAYAKCFTGVDMVNWIMAHKELCGNVKQRKDAERLGQLLLAKHYIHHISYKHQFEDKYVFFKFQESAQSEPLEVPFQNFPELMRNGELDFQKLFKIMIDDNTGVIVKVRRKGIKQFTACFVGSEYVDYLVNNYHVSRSIGVDIGIKMMADGYISHVTESYPFADENFFYRFNYEMIAKKSNKKRLSLGLAMASFWLHSNGKPFRDGWMSVTIKTGGKMSKMNAWLTLDNEGLLMYSDDKKTKCIYKLTLAEVVRIHRTPIQGSFTITTVLQTKVVFFSKNEMDLGTWQFALDAFKYPNHFSGTCIDFVEKEGLLKKLYFDGFKGGLIKSNEDEEWSYTSDGILHRVDGVKSDGYTWNGHQLTPLSEKEHGELGRWDGIRIAWMDGALPDPDPTLTYIHYEGEYQNQDPLLNFKWTRHFLASTSNSNYWALNGDVPSPVVMFLQIIQQKKLMYDQFDKIMHNVGLKQSISV